MRKWTRNEKIGAWTVVVAVIAIAVGFFEKPGASTRVIGDNNVAGNQIAGNGNVLGNNNQFNQTVVNPAPQIRPIIEVNRVWKALGIPIASGENAVIVEVVNPANKEAADAVTFNNDQDRTIVWPLGIERIHWPGNGSPRPEMMFRYVITNAGNIDVFHVRGTFTGVSGSPIKFDIDAGALQAAKQFVFYVVNESSDEIGIRPPESVTLQVAGHDEVQQVAMRRAPEYPDLLDLANTLPPTRLKWTGTGRVKE